MESNENLHSKAQHEMNDSAPISDPALENAAELATTPEIIEEKAVEEESISTPVNSEPEEKNEVVEETQEEPALSEETVEVVLEELAAETEEIIAEEGIDEEVEEIEPRADLPDYSNLSEVELINELRELLQETGFFEIVDRVESIKSNFYKKHKAKLIEEKKSFIDNGGFEEEFKPEADPYEQDLKTLLAQFKQRKAELNKDIEAEKEENLKKKYEIIEEIKTLVNRKESINKTFQEFRELQQKWREIGLVPQANMKDYWENYHHHVENFYDYIKINKELRDLDLKRNLEEKISLCEKAEALLLEPSVIKSFNALQKFHDLWREIGPVPRDKKEELWERFKTATTLINKKHQDFFENRKKSQRRTSMPKLLFVKK
jgi:hypothetical protein